MRKSTLLLASALCVANLGFAQNEKVLAEISLSGDFKPIEVQIQTPQKFNFLKANDAILKAPAATAALDAPVASAATDVEISKFTANWSAVNGANGYYLQVNRSFKTTTDSAMVLHLYENFNLTTPGVATEGDNGVLLFNEGQTMRDWTLYDGQTAENAVEINPGGQLYTPLMDFSNTAVEKTTSLYVNFAGMPGDNIDIGIVYVKNNELYGGSVMSQPISIGAEGKIAGTLTFPTNPVYEQFGLYFEPSSSNQSAIAMKYFYCYQIMAPGQQWDMAFTGIETTKTSQLVYTIEYDENTPGVTEEFYYAVLAYSTNLAGSISDQSDFSNIIVVGDNAAVDDVVVSNDKVFVSDNLHVQLAAPAQVSIYNAAGALVGSYQGVEGDNEFALPTSGVYVVKAGNTIAKVLK